MSIHRVVRRGDSMSDAGNTLIVAVMVSFLVMALGLVVVSQAITTNQDSGRDRRRAAQVHTAEAGLDRMYYQLQTGTAPCPTEAGSFVSEGAPDATSVVASVQYWDAEGNSTDPCVSGSEPPARAIITATATSSNDVGAGTVSTRTMESEVLLSPLAGGEGYAIFSYGDLTLPNSFELTSPGSSPDIYTRGKLVCENGVLTTGNVVVSTAGANLSNTCSIGGRLHVRGDVVISNSAVVGGDVISSRGKLEMSNTARVEGDAWLAGSATFKNTAKVVGTTHAGLGTNTVANPDPHDQPMPYIGWDKIAWQTAGFAIREVGSSCSTIASEMFSVNVPTAFYGNCKLSFSNNNSGLRLKTDVAVFVEDGLSISNNFGLTADQPGETHKLWLISPAGVGPEPSPWNPATCTGGDISLGNKTAITPSVTVFLYTCGKLSADNSTTFYGQLYGKNVTVANSYKMAFVGLPPVGVDLGGEPAAPGYNVGVVYKREIPTP